MSLRIRVALVAPAILTLAACGEDPATAPVAPRGAVVASALKGDRLATVEWEGRFPALYLQDVGGKERMRVRFENVHDKIDGNYPAEMLPVTDDRIIAMSNPKWSPDGQQLAVVVAVAFDQSQVIVMNADGRQLRTESINGQIIMGDVDWSPDSRRIAYAMSTLNHARGVDLFVTDLVTEKVQRITTEGRFGAYDQYRWDPTGTGLWYTQWEGWADDGWNRIARVYHATLGGQVDGLPFKAVGDFQAISRDGRWGLTVRYTRDGRQEFVRHPLARDVEEQVLATGEFMYAKLLEGDDEVVLVGYNPTGAPSYTRYGTMDGAPRGRLEINPNASSFGLLRAGR
jgi:WD40-like Beta Propeller Repeat